MKTYKIKEPDFVATERDQPTLYGPHGSYGVFFKYWIQEGYERWSVSEKTTDGYLILENEFKTQEEAKTYAIKKWTEDIEQYLVEIK